MDGRTHTFVLGKKKGILFRFIVSPIDFYSLNKECFFFSLFCCVLSFLKVFSVNLPVQLHRIDRVGMILSFEKTIMICFIQLKWSNHTFYIVKCLIVIFPSMNIEYIQMNGRKLTACVITQLWLEAFIYICLLIHKPAQRNYSVLLAQNEMHTTN